MALNARVRHIDFPCRHSDHPWRSTPRIDVDSASIRGGDYHLDGIRLFPSYLQAGPAYFIEASKRRMIAEDIRAAMGVAS